MVVGMWRHSHDYLAMSASTQHPDNISFYISFNMLMQTNHAGLTYPAMAGMDCAEHIANT